MSSELKARVAKLRIRTEALLLKARTGRARIPGDGDGDGIPYEGRKPKGQKEAGPSYAERTQQRVNEGMSRGDAQGVEDAKDLKRTRSSANSKHSQPPKAPSLRNDDQKGDDNMPNSKKYQDAHVATVTEALRSGNLMHAQAVRRRAGANSKFYSSKGEHATAGHWKAIGDYASSAAKHIAWRSKRS